MSATELQRKCAKCHIAATNDDCVNLRFHRFPLPGKHGSLKARVWAEYCYPAGNWSTEKSLRSLHQQHKMVCSKHFDDTSYTSSSRKRLNNFAIPIGTESIMLKLRQEQSLTSSDTSANPNVPNLKLQALVTESTVPVEESTLDKSTTRVLEVFPCAKMLKRRKRAVISGECREFVVHLREYFELENQNGGPLLPLAQVCDRVADGLGISRTTVCRISKEKYGESSFMPVEETEKKLSTPNKKRKNVCPVTQVDDFEATAIRNHIYAYYKRGEYPTLKKLEVSLIDANLYNASKPSLARLLKKIGFIYKKRDKTKIIMERTDIALARVYFLRKAKLITDWRKVVFLGETYLNVKGQRFIIVHAGTSSGFVSNCLLVFKSMKTIVSHEEITFEKLKEWFLTLLYNLDEPHVIIMGNAPHHSVQKNKPPTSSNSKKDLIAYLQSKGIDANETMLKNELLQLINIHKPRTPTYILDEIAKEKGHTVIRLPLYHCHYNAIELIWVHVKRHAASYDTKPPFLTDKIQTLLHNVCEDVTGFWRNVVDKCRKIIDEDWERDVRFDQLSDQESIIKLQDCSSDSESDEDSDLGCTPLY